MDFDHFGWMNCILNTDDAMLIVVFTDLTQNLYCFKALVKTIVDLKSVIQTFLNVYIRLNGLYGYD